MSCMSSIRNQWENKISGENGNITSIEVNKPSWCEQSVKAHFFYDWKSYSIKKGTVTYCVVLNLQSSLKSNCHENFTVNSYYFIHVWPTNKNYENTLQPLHQWLNETKKTISITCINWYWSKSVISVSSCLSLKANGDLPSYS